MWGVSLRPGSGPRIEPSETPTIGPLYARGDTTAARTPGWFRVHGGGCGVGCRMQAGPVTVEILGVRHVVAVEVVRPGIQVGRPGWVRPVAVALVIYGAIGLVLTLVLIVVGVAIWPQLQAVSGQLGTSLHATSVTVGSAATAM